MQGSHSAKKIIEATTSRINQRSTVPRHLLRKKQKKAAPLGYSWQATIETGLKETRKGRKPGNRKNFSAAREENLQERKSERERERASIFQPRALKHPVYQDTAERKASVNTPRDVGGVVKVERPIHPRRGEQTGRAFSRLLVVIVVASRARIARRYSHCRGRRSVPFMYREL